MAGRENSIVFSPGRIGNIEIKNRLVRSATYENAATDNGEATDVLVEIYRMLGQGGVGLIITGITGVYPKALAPAKLMRIDNDSYIPGLTKVSKAVHDLGNDCKIMLQLHHPGRQILDPEKAASLLPPALVAYMEKAQISPPTAEEAEPEIEPTAPSAIFDPTFQRTPRALTLEEVDEIIDAFAEGIRRAQEAGFDGVQLHAAHGWLLSSFLSPHTNQREDQYGGSTENRTRMVKEIYERARKKVGKDFPILIKMNTTDFLPTGSTLDEAAKVGEILSKTGFAALEASGGMWEALTRDQEELGWMPVLLPESRVGIKTRDQEAYFLEGAKKLKNRTNTPIILVGGVRSFDKIEEIVGSGWADFLSMSRPLIRQPDLPNLWLTGEGPDRAECISCNTCLPLGEDPTSCKVKKSER